MRLRVALALGASDDPRTVAALAAIARRDGADRWVRAAVFSGLRDRGSAFLDALQSAATDVPMATATRAAVMQDLGRLFGASEPADRCVALVAAIADPDARMAAFALTVALREAGVRTELEQAGRSMKGQLKHADRIQAR